MPSYEEDDHVIPELFVGHLRLYIKRVSQRWSCSWTGVDAPPQAYRWACHCRDVSFCPVEVCRSLSRDRQSDEWRAFGGTRFRVLGIPKIWEGFKRETRNVRRKLLTYNGEAMLSMTSLYFFTKGLWLSTMALKSCPRAVVPDRRHKMNRLASVSIVLKITYQLRLA